jgi:hypothetical protein
VSIFTRSRARLVVLLVTLIAAFAVAPAPAGAWSGNHRWRPTRAYGATSLILDAATAQALTSLGVAPGLINPAYAADGALNFPIKTPPYSALARGIIRHSGGISLTAGSTTVDLTNFDINVPGQVLTAQVNGGARVPILNLDYSAATVGFSGGQLAFGPVTASLTATAAGALNQAFNVTTFTPGLVLGQATITYQLFGS